MTVHTKKAIKLVEDKDTHPNPEVSEKRMRRRFTAKYKLEILNEVDACRETGQIGKLLRREGLYSSSIAIWRKQRDQGMFSGLTPKKRGRKKEEQNPLKNKLTKLEEENKRLRERLKKAEMVIDVQKKISHLLTDYSDNNERSECE